MMKNVCLFLSVLSCLWLSTGPALAVIYKYVDKNGRLVFVDDESKIPAQYRPQTTPIKEQVDSLTAEELRDYQRQLAEKRTEQELRRQAQQQAALETQRQTFQTPVMIRGNRVMVATEVAARNRVAHLILLLDTGASKTVLHRPAIAHLPLKKGEQRQAMIAGGRTIPAEKVELRYLEVGPFREKNTEVMLLDPVRTDLPYDGMLGNDFLRKHPYTIDYDNETISWSLPENK